MACEKCWRDAALDVLLLGGSQAERYAELLEQRKNNPCSPAEQRGEPDDNKEESNESTG